MALIYNDKIGFLAHTIKQESVLDHRLYTRLDAKGVKQLPQRLEIERLAATTIALVLAFAHRRVHTECGPCSRLRLITMQQIADINQFGQQALILVVAFLYGKWLLTLINLAPVQSGGINHKLEQLARLFFGNSYHKLPLAILINREHRRHVTIIMLYDVIGPYITVAQIRVGMTSDAATRYLNPTITEIESLRRGRRINKVKVVALHKMAHTVCRQIVAAQ